MTLIGLIVLLIVVGILLWLINSLIPMDPKIKTIINVLVVLLVLLWIVGAFFGPQLGMGHIGYVR